MRDVDIEHAELYASRKCNKCWGKGYHINQLGHTSTTIRKDRPIRERVIYCDCVIRNKNKWK